MAKKFDEIIQSIEQVEDYIIKFIDEYQDYNQVKCDGYIITTNKSEIFVGIQNTQFCCENFGYITSNDNLNDYVGEKLVRISVTDSQRKSYNINKDQYYDGNTMFVNFTTKKGSFQLVVYNAHNGNYSHRAFVMNNTKIIEQVSL